DEGALLDARAVLLDAVVVDHHRAAAEAGTGADVGVPDVGEVVGLDPRAEPAVLHLDEVPDPRAAAELGARPQVGAGADGHVVTELGGFDHAVRLDAAALSDAGRTRDHAARLDHRVAADLHVGVEIGGLGIDQRDPVDHQPLGDAAAHHGGRARQLR